MGRMGTRVRCKRSLSSQNLCCVPEVTITRRIRVRLGSGRPASSASEYKGTTTSSREQEQNYCVPEENRKMASDAAKCRDLERRRHSRKISNRHDANLRRRRRCCLEGKEDQPARGHEAMGQRSCQRRQRRMDGGGESPLMNVPMMTKGKPRGEVQS